MFDNEVDFFLANIKIFIGRPGRKIHLSHGRAAVGPSGSPLLLPPLGLRITSLTRKWDQI